MARYQLKFMFDWGSGVCVWSVNEAAGKKFGKYAVETERLPVSRVLKDWLTELTARHDEALNWDNPGGDLLWDRARQAAFTEEAQAAHRRLCNELGPDYEVSFKQIF